VPAGRARKAALLVFSGVAMVVAGGCGSANDTTPAGRRLQREDLVATAGALGQARAEVAREVAATKAVWPVLANGLPAPMPIEAERRIAVAAQLAAALKHPGVLQEQRAIGLTGPGASMVGDFQRFTVLAARGWQMIQYALQTIRRGGAGASFARTTVPLYIDAVYDGHFGLAQIGKKLLAGYKKLGGPAAFGAELSPAEVNSLAEAYSEPSCRLQPHPGVKLGS
jgi:hypothetical protein